MQQNKKHHWGPEVLNYLVLGACGLHHNMDPITERIGGTVVFNLEEIENESEVI